MGELDEWKHCPRCGSDGLAVAKGKAECPECGFLAYASAKPTASAVCLDDEGRVLLSLRAEEPLAGRWDLPGGFLDEEEHPLDCLRRELREEGGVDVEPLDFLGVWIDKYGGDGSAQSTLNFYWTARIVSGTLEAADDVAEFRWFLPDEVDEEELAFPHTREVLSLVRQQDP